MKKLLLSLLAVGSAAAFLPAQPLSPAAPGVIARDNDDLAIAEPKRDRDAESIWWDGGYHMFVYQIPKPFDANWLLRKTHLLPKEEAENINSLDEVPDSTWFTNRHGMKRLSPEEIMRGADDGTGPSEDGPWLVISGKTEGLTPGFFVQDAKGQKFLMKFDPAAYPGLGSNSDMIGSRVLYAAGYNTPAYYLVSFDPKKLALAPNAQTQGKYKIKRPMTAADVEGLMARVPKEKDGRVRAELSRLLSGAPKGPFDYKETRQDDPNDTVRHENRRELRGLRVIMSWLNNTDARRGNTLDMYVEENGKKFLKHYHLDFSASIGSGNVEPKPTRYGHEYVIDPKKIGMSILSLGFWIKPWETELPVRYPEVGKFDSGLFEPGTWLTSYANPAFEKLTARDAFWGAKLVTAFTDEDIKAIVSKARYDNPEARDYVIQTLIARRDKIGRHWLDVSRVNPLDNFTMTGARELAFEDLAVDRHYAERSQTQYRYRIDRGPWNETGETHWALPENVKGCTIRTSRDQGRHWGKPLLLKLEPGHETLQVTSITR